MHGPFSGFHIVWSALNRRRVKGSTFQERKAARIRERMIMRDISQFPSDATVSTMNVDDLAGMVAELGEQDRDGRPLVNVCGPAAMDVNRFLSQAALRLARERLSNPR